MKNITKKQHRIPKFLLKNWGKNLVYIDLATRYISYKKPEDSTVKNFFYESEKNNLNLIENKISVVESKAAPILSKIIENDSVNLSPSNLEILMKFFDLQSIRVSDKKNEIEIKENIFDILMKESYDKTKNGLIERIEEIIDLKVADEISKFRKWRKKIINNHKVMKSLDGSIMTEYDAWYGNKNYSLSVFRFLTDMAQSKIFVIENKFNENIVTDIFSSGARNKFGQVFYYSFVVSPKKTIIFYLDQYGKNEENIFSDIAKKSKRISFIKNYEILTHKVDEKLNFMNQLMVLNETKEFIICHSLNHVFNFVINASKYALSENVPFKFEFQWINNFIMDNLEKEYKEEVKNLEKKDWRF